MIIYRYLSRQLLTTTLAVSSVLVLILVCGRFIKYLAEAAEGALTGTIVFWAMIYRLPGFLELILPLGLFLGILLSYGRMYLENEMVVLEACGMSQTQLVKLTLIPALCMALIVGLMSNYLSPLGTSKARIMVEEQKKRSALELLSPGQFHASRDGLTVTYVEGVDGPKKEMQNLFIVNYNQSNVEKVELTRAQHGEYRLDAITGARYLVMKDGFRFEGTPGTAKFNRTAYKTYNLKLEPPEPFETVGEYTLMTNSELRKEGSPKAIAELQWRTAVPLLVPIVAYLAVLLSKVNPRQGRYMKLLPAIILYLAYLSLLLAMKNKVASGALPQEVGLWWVHGIFFCMTIVVHLWPGWRLRWRKLPEVLSQ